MNLPDEIRTIDDFREVNTTINKSIFIAQVYPLTADDEIKEHILKAKKKYYDATHHCYAYKLVNGNFRYSDAGEPNGSAGIRILNAIDHFKLTNQLVIVSRIFGGVKLGVGPLGKAYYQSAYQVLDEAKIITKQLFRKVEILSDISHASIIHGVLANYKSFVIESEYEEAIKMTCLLRNSEIELFSQKLSDSGKNKIILKFHNKFEYR